MKKIIFVLLILFYNQSAAQLFVTDIKNNLINLDALKKPVFIIFYQSPSCHQCFVNLNNALKLIDSNVTIYTIIKSQNDIVQRKEIQIEISNYYSSTAIFYDIIENTQNHNNSLFQHFKITNTPALLFIEDGAIKYVSYTEIFGDGRDLLDIKSRILALVFNK